MNDAERRELETYAAEHVADGIVRYGAAGMSEGDRRAFVEKLAREAIDEAARSMVDGASPRRVPRRRTRSSAGWWPRQLGLGRLQLLLDEDDIENININGADTCGSSGRTASKNRSRRSPTPTRSSSSWSSGRPGRTTPAASAGSTPPSPSSTSTWPAATGSRP